MRKFLLSVVCGLLVVGVANLGHAGLFSFFGGSGGKKKSASQGVKSADLFKLDFHQFGVKKDDSKGDSALEDKGSILEELIQELLSQSIFDSPNRIDTNWPIRVRPLLILIAQTPRRWP
jgi:hypothetical protein